MQSDMFFKLMGEACRDSLQFKFGLDDLKSLFQTKQFYDSIVSHFILLGIFIQGSYTTEIVLSSTKICFEFSLLPGRKKKQKKGKIFW